MIYPSLYLGLYPHSLYISVYLFLKFHLYLCFTVTLLPHHTPIHCFSVLLSLSPPLSPLLHLILPILELSPSRCQTLTPWVFLEWQGVQGQLQAGPLPEPGCQGEGGQFRAHPPEQSQPVLTGLPGAWATAWCLAVSG